MSQNDQLYDFLKAVYDQITPERVYSWIKADSNGRGILRRMDYAYGFSQEKHPELKTYKEDNNPYGLLNILTAVTNERGVKYCELADNEINEVISWNESSCSKLKQSLAQYMTANYSMFDTVPNFTFEDCLGDIEEDVSIFSICQIPTATRFYRLREMAYSRGRRVLDFYHIPFTHRYLMGTYRYSIPGYPSLYAASSIYGAWEEMGRKSVMNYGYIAFKTKNQIHLLDLRWRFDNSIKENKEDLMHYIQRLPVIIACSMQVRHSRDKFVPEYIIPQQIFKWLMGKLLVCIKDFPTTSTPVWGITYTSNKDTGWNELTNNGKYGAQIKFEDITNYALLAYLPLDGEFSQYSYDLGENLYVATPRWLKEQPSARDCSYNTLNAMQRHFENPRLSWRGLGEEIKKVEKLTNQKI